MQRDDHELVDALRAGNANAVEMLIQRYGAWIYRVAARVLGDHRDAEEVTQNVLMTVVRKIGTFKGEAAFSSWIYRIAANAAYDHARARRARVDDVSLDALLPVFDEMGRHVEPVVDWSRDLQDPAVAAEVRVVLEQAIGNLPEDYRVVLVLRDIEDLTTEEVAQALGLTAAAVKSRLHRARLFLRKAFTEWNGRARSGAAPPRASSQRQEGSSCSERLPP
ncbi:MAG: sigma-70 family RNA polymerase sigma factor [Candidatus Rokubacteria bacterium]|nr:sigma-70 family RNA polymerase sigma factor [Candidatus Rokubacteria bacterium]